ncbi:MAG TPA: methylated-DNA--[protein]-cysteine S-methyltransferase [Terriglobales bacterium]|nr:methylated-DNA--[protein]-cysteine S-methyltransferase [Terriglobales bacterium]
MSTPIGGLHIAASGRGLRFIEFAAREFPPHKSKSRWKKSREATSAYVSQLQEYFAGKRREFSFPLDLAGTPFQLRCWDELMRIPYGQTRSYGELARAVNCARGFRAVGQANHRNPLPIVVPCHRVLAADGTLGGYGGGLEIKRKLLQIEGACFKEKNRQPLNLAAGL